MEKSTYIRISKIILRKLYKLGCWGKGSIYGDTLKKGFPPEDEGLVIKVTDALVRQGILGKKRKEHGDKYFLNSERRSKIMEIMKIR